MLDMTANSVGGSKITKNDLAQSLHRLVKLSNTFEKIGFASDTYLGYLTVSPDRLGTAITFNASISVPSLAFYECKDAISDKLLNLQMTAGIRY